jgi:hypothetical protein
MRPFIAFLIAPAFPAMLALPFVPVIGSDLLLFGYHRNGLFQLSSSPGCRRPVVSLRSE